MEERFREARIAVVQDGVSDATQMARTLAPASSLVFGDTRDGPPAFSLLHEFRPDAVLLDLRLPGTHRRGVLDAVRRATPEDEYVPVLDLGPDEAAAPLRVRVGAALAARDRYRSLRARTVALERRIAVRTLEVMRRRYPDSAASSHLDDPTDPTTGQHTKRVGVAAARIAATLGWSEGDVRRLRLAAPLHDVGKVVVPERILMGDGPLGPSDFEVMKTHCRIGAELLTGSSDPVLAMAAEIALSHHERWDGAGYPHGRSRREIPLSARIVAVADTYDALVHARPYKRGWHPSEALAAVVSGAGTRFDPEVVDAFSATLAAPAVAVRLVG